MDLLSRLKERNKKVAVVSNKFYAATQALCRHFIANLCRMDSIGHMRIYYGETSIPISDSYKDAVYQFVNSAASLSSVRTDGTVRLTGSWSPFFRWRHVLSEPSPGWMA